MPRKTLLWLLANVLLLQMYSKCVAQFSSYTHVTDYLEQEDLVPVTPCKAHRPGDPDLTTYDIISSLRLEEFHARNEGVQQIIGSTGFQTAYHLEEYSNMTIESIQAFPKGVPNEFSFECTFRVPQQQPHNEWNLFELTDYRYESQMSITINPIYNTIDFSLPKYDGSVQTITFEEREIFDRSWHKVMFGITQDAVRLWIDCKPVPDLRGTYRAPLDVRGPIDASEGAFSIARDCRTKSTVPIDVQWMIFSCDAEKPARSNCQDLALYERTPPPPPAQPLPPVEIRRPQPPYVIPSVPRPTITPTRKSVELFFEQTTTERPWLLSSTPAALVGQESTATVCPVQCPRGLPGPPGQPGLPGINGADGAPGAPGSVTYERLEIKGERGERGYPGEPGPPGAPATTADASEYSTTSTTTTTTQRTAEKPDVTPKRLNGIDEQELRELILAVVREYIGENSGTLTGPPGLPGIRGRNGNPGAQGIPGAPGVRGAPGERGYPGLPGVQGLQGDIGPIGPEGQKGDRGDIGAPGRDGLNGSEGPQGPPGQRGRDGLPGRPGLAGAIGAQGEQGKHGPPGAPGVCPDCSAQTAQYMYPLMLAQQQYNSKGPQGYYSNKGPEAYYTNNKGPQDLNNKG